MPKKFLNYVNNNPLIVSCCLCGAGTKKNQAPTVPYTPEEISDQAIEAAKAGAAVVHIHVREDKEVNGKMEIGYKSMSLDMFTQTVELVRKKALAEGVDVVINLTTSGGEYEDYKRLQHLGALKPEMCSFDPGTLNWANSYIFENSPRFLNLLGEEVVKQDVKPEFEVFDTGHIDSVKYYCDKWGIPQPAYYQFIMNVGGAMPGTPGNLAFLVDKLPDGAIWSVSGIGRAHMPMIYTGLALGCDGLRVGLEDNIMYGKDENGNKVIATNKMLVERAVRIAKEFGRPIATAQQAREILGITRNCIKQC
ncbi:MAG: 3-keto-5-aminohexanoate cleavage protein [Oscillospiraceae bacterium]|nr:3-keto-5-aminohexanoate cleavage protein [Oscillospiraceae bacterium]MCD8191617.1 3-keto-5-aminohexanoate cleavage protein [Oscillospiraceae bacterium]